VAFLIESVERLPPPLDGIAREVTVHFPWGSLLAGVIAADPATLARLAALLKPGGELRILISATARDRYAETGPALLRSRSDRYTSAGLALIESREARPDDVAASRSSWAKRLGAGRGRPVVFARCRRLGS